MRATGHRFRLLDPGRGRPDGVGGDAEPQGLQLECLPDPARQLSGRSRRELGENLSQPPCATDGEEFQGGEHLLEVTASENQIQDQTLSTVPELFPLQPFIYLFCLFLVVWGQGNQIGIQ